MATPTIDVKRLKDAVRTGYAWPGGYELAYVTTDGALLCNDCVRSNWREVLSGTKQRDGSGWGIAGICYEAVTPDFTREMAGDDYISYCDHCNKEYGEMG